MLSWDVQQGNWLKAINGVQITSVTRPLPSSVSIVRSFIGNVHQRVTKFWLILGTTMISSTCMLSASAPVCKPLQPADKGVRARRSASRRSPGRTNLCLASSSRPDDDWTNLRIGPQSSGFRKVTSSMADNLYILNPIPTATGGEFDVWPAEVSGSFAGFTDGRRKFWQGSNSRSSGKRFLLDQQAAMQCSFFHRVLAPTNLAIQGDDLTGWSGTGNAKSVVPLGGRPDFMCASETLLLLLRAGAAWPFLTLFEQSPVSWSHIATPEKGDMRY